MVKILTGADTLTISPDSRSSHPRMSGGFRKSSIVPDGRGIEAIEATVETDQARRGYGWTLNRFLKGGGDPENRMPESARRSKSSALPDTVFDGWSGVLDYRRRGRCPISVRINWLLQVRLTLAYKREFKPFANIPGIRSLGNELSSEPLDKQKYSFPDRVDKQHVRKIDN
jgi:hypothetical protein